MGCWGCWWDWRRRWRWPQEAAKPELNSGDTAWMLTSTALVLFMTIPGLSLFYARHGARQERAVGDDACFAITALVTVLWTIYGYSLAFDATGMEAEADQSGIR